jgi:hypothetical protein
VRLAVIVLVGCSGGWKPHVWSELDDPEARAVTVEFPDGQHGTELVLAVLAQAKAAEVSGISKLEIQLGRCVREISTQPAARLPATEPTPELERIVVRARETKYTCKQLVEQQHTRGSGSGLDGLGDAQLVESDACEHTPVEHVVARYRFELERRFVPPDWNEIARWTHVKLAFGPPRCGGEPKNEISARFHKRSHPAPPALRPAAPASAAAIVELVKRAQAAAEARRPGEATDLAEQALAMLAHDLGPLDDDVASWIAAAHFYAVEIDVDRMLRREQPVKIDAAWAAEIGIEIDRIAKRYERIKDLVRMPVVARWLRAGAAQLAKLHLHAAKLLEAGGHSQAAEREREIARSLVAASKANL